MEQIRIYEVNIPTFINSFKQKIIQFLIPNLIQLKRVIYSQSNEKTVNPLLSIVTAFFVIYFIQYVIWQIFYKNVPSQSNQHKQQSPEAIHQLNDLKKQLKSLKTSFAQMTKQFNSINKNKEFQSTQNSHSSSIQNFNNQKPALNSNQKVKQLWNQILPVYTDSLENNKKLVNYVLQTQFQVIKQLKKLKKYQRESLSSGRPSTVRSRTSDKKMQGLARSPQKNNSLLSSNKKMQIKNTQKNVKSQIQQKNIRSQTRSKITKIQQRKSEPLQMKPELQQQRTQFQQRKSEQPGQSKPTLNQQIPQVFIRQQSPQLIKKLQEQNEKNLKKALNRNQISNNNIESDIKQNKKQFIKRNIPPVPLKKQVINRQNQNKRKEQILIQSQNFNINSQQNDESSDEPLSKQKMQKNVATSNPVEHSIIHSTVQRSIIQQSVQMNQGQFTSYESVKNQTITSKTVVELRQNPNEGNLDQEMRQQQIPLVIPMKVPTIKKMVPPKVGNKRAPPPPPRK